MYLISKSFFTDIAIREMYRKVSIHISHKYRHWKRKFLTKDSVARDLHLSTAFSRDKISVPSKNLRVFVFPAGHSPSEKKYISLIPYCIFSSWHSYTVFSFSFLSTEFRTRTNGSTLNSENLTISYTTRCFREAKSKAVNIRDGNCVLKSSFKGRQKKGASYTMFERDYYFHEIIAVNLYNLGTFCSFNIEKGICNIYWMGRRNTFSFYIVHPLYLSPLPTQASIAFTFIVFLGVNTIYIYFFLLVWTFFISEESNYFSEVIWKINILSPHWKF